MTNILYITASIQSEEESVTRDLGRRLVEGLSARHNATVTKRDLAKNEVPYVSAERFEANLTAPEDRTEKQSELAAYADMLIKELQDADIIVFASPVYNFNVPATVKAWADLVARNGTTFKYTDNGPVGLLENKKAYIAMASGGTEMGSDIDFMSTWLRHFLQFLGIEIADAVAADGLMGENSEEKIAEAKEKIAAMFD